MAVVTQIQLRRDTAANWTSTNPTLASGEMGFETDTGLFKIGNGSTAWTSLAYGVSVTTTNTAKTGTTYTFVASDAGAIVTASNASALTYSIPTNASVPFAIGSQISVISIGAGLTTLQAVTSGTTTVLSTGATAASPKLRAQYSSATAIKISTDLWYVVGDVA